MKKDFQATMAMPGFEETTMYDPGPYPKVPPAAKVREGYRRIDDGDRRVDWSGILIVVVVILTILIAALPQFAWFQNLTAITGWIEFMKNVFGWR